MEEATHEKLDLSAICHVGPDTAGGQCSGVIGWRFPGPKI